MSPCCFHGDFTKSRLNISFAFAGHNLENFEMCYLQKKNETKRTNSVHRYMLNKMLEICHVMILMQVMKKFCKLAQHSIFFVPNRQFVQQQDTHTRSCSHFLGPLQHYHWLAFQHIKLFRQVSSSFHIFFNVSPILFRFEFFFLALQNILFTLLLLENCTEFCHFYRSFFFFFCLRQEQN